MRFLAVLAAIALAGCTLADDSDDDSSSDVSTDADDRSFLINLGGPAFGPVEPAYDLGEFEVDENATGLYLEAAWTCATATCTLDLVLLDGNGSEVARAPGSGSATLFVATPPAGDYQFGVVTSTDVVGQADGRVAASAFYGHEMPEGYTALDGQGAH